jgi:anti-sigma factor RsiW
MNEQHPLEEKLSAYLDGELTQQEAQRVSVALRHSPELRAKYEDLKRLRDEIRSLDFPAPNDQEWRRIVGQATFKTTRGLGWLLWAGAAAVLTGYALWEFATDPSIEALERIGVLTMLLGIALVFLTVLWERLGAHKHDKYKDIER